MTAADHAAEARAALARSVDPTAVLCDTAEPEVGRATAHALLALVEQQRIANLIALANVVLLDGDAEVTPMERTAWEALGVKYTGEMRPEIAAALGIETKEMNE